MATPSLSQGRILLNPPAILNRAVRAILPRRVRLDGGPFSSVGRASHALVERPRARRRAAPFGDRSSLDLLRVEEPELARRRELSVGAEARFGVLDVVERR